jgi:hypothetical protein
MHIYSPSSFATSKPGTMSFNTQRIEERLATMTARSQQIHGSIGLCYRVAERFAALLQLLVSKGEGGRELAHERDFLKAFEDFYKAVAFQNYYTQVLRRLATSLRVVSEVYQAHFRINELYLQLGETETPELSSDWREYWDGDRKEQVTWFSNRLGSMDNQLIRELVTEIDNPDKLAEVLAIMTTQRQVRTSDSPSAIDDVDLRASPAILALIELVQERIKDSRRVYTPVDMYTWYIDAMNVKVGKAFGVEEGTFGALYHGTWTDVNTTPATVHDDVAIKRLSSELSVDAYNQQFSRELAVWKQLDHPNILKLHGAQHVASPRYFVCEFADGGNLLDLFMGGKHRNLLWDKFGQAAVALQYLHSKNIEHGGLKCHNILITKDGVVKLTDFGVSVVRTQSQSFSQRAERDKTRWKAPEQLQLDTRMVDHKRGDVYSLGLCIIEALTTEIPFGMLADEDVIDLKLRQVPVERPDGAFTDEEWALVSRMVHNDPTMRPTAEELVALMSSQEAAGPCAGCDQLNPTSYSVCSQCGERLAAAA